MYFPEQKKEIINGIPHNYICHIEQVEKNGTVYPGHYHSYIEILYGLSGSYEVLLNGKSHLFGEGELVLINSKEVHQINCISLNGGQYIVLRFEPEIIYNNMFQNHLHLKYVFPFIIDNSKHQKVIRKEVIEETEIEKLLHDILREYQDKSYGYELAIKINISRIFLWILRYFHQTNNSLTPTSFSNIELLKKFQESFDYVLEHYHEDIKATKMASLCHMSYSYFSRSFNQLMGMNFNEYVNYIRTLEAEKLLITSNESITDIAFTVGFNSTSYFIKLFKSYKKMTPKQFRKKFVTTLSH